MRRRSHHLTVETVRGGLYANAGAVMAWCSCSTWSAGPTDREDAEAGHRIHLAAVRRLREGDGAGEALRDPYTGVVRP